MNITKKEAAAWDHRPHVYDLLCCQEYTRLMRGIAKLHEKPRLHNVEDMGSGARGVYISPVNHNWRAVSCASGKPKQIGTYRTIKLAEKAIEKYEKALHRENKNKIQNDRTRNTDSPKLRALQSADDTKCTKMEQNF